MRTPDQSLRHHPGVEDALERRRSRPTPRLRVLAWQPAVHRAAEAAASRRRAAAVRDEGGRVREPAARPGAGDRGAGPPLGRAVACDEGAVASRGVRGPCIRRSAWAPVSTPRTLRTWPATVWRSSTCWIRPPRRDGRVIDWALAPKPPRLRPIILAGGRRARHTSRRVIRVRPFAVARVVRGRARARDQDAGRAAARLSHRVAAADAERTPCA